MSRRSFSMNVHHPPEKKGDSYHVVALTSSTLGSMKLDQSFDIEYNTNKWDEFEREESDLDGVKKNDEVGVEKTMEFTMGMIEAKAWSKMIDEKITKVAPKTPIRTPPGEPETIDVKELMEGLEGYSPLRLGEHHVRSFSFHVSADSIPPLVDSPRTDGFLQNGVESPKNNTKAWFDDATAQEKDDGLSNGNTISKAMVAEFDPEVISAFRKALEELSPTNPFHLKPRDGVRDQQQLIKDHGMLQVADKLNGEENGFVQDNGFAHVNGFVDRIIAEDKDDNLSLPDNEYGPQTNEIESADLTNTLTKERVILYFTSLRGVRRTYENCCYVRLILKGLGVRVDERDVSMHSGFKEELRDLLGDDRFKDGLPKVFIGERYIGGIEEIRKMHEDGKLEKLVENCERMEDDGGSLLDVCEACGDIRFVPCETCSGSCKIYYECEEEDEEEYEEDEYGFQRCPDCNENGLIRCPICCY
ncbi:hypothetical protein BVRB_009400 [Beta vulgaris subsp. vulgaris]|uniref:Glutaredoxin domain-containing protein n=2 Tax=Beta vulgaris subsp. vulgaris TaxID=3555 RepID=A0A0J8B5Z9_BETVV|nr:hypothetical protein BVRB_009400 [Beta vulgaris subsp. vulgaris]